MLIRSVIQYHFDDDANVPLVGRRQKCFEILQRAVAGVHRAVVRDVIAIIAQRGWIEWEQPDCVHSQFVQVVEFLLKASKVAYAVSIAVVESSHVQLINDRVFVPIGLLHDTQVSGPPDTRYFPWLVARYLRQMRRRTLNTCAGLVGGASST